MLATPATVPPEDGGWAFEIKWDGVRALAYCEERRASHLVAARRGREPPLPRADGAPRRARRAGGDPGRRGSRVRRRRPAQLPDASETHGPLAARDDPPPLAGGAGDLRRLRPPAPRFGVAPRRALRAPPRASRRARALDGDCWRAPGAPDRRRAGVPRSRPRPRGSRGSCASGSAPRTGPGRRSADWLKIRARLGQELVVGGYMPGEGGRTGSVGSLLVGYWDRTPDEAVSTGSAQKLVYAGGVGTGFTDEMLKRLRALLEPLRIDEMAFELGEDPRAQVQGPRASPRRRAGLGRAAPRLRGRVHGVDVRGHAPPAVVQGSPRRQGPSRGRARDLGALPKRPLVRFRA